MKTTSCSIVVVLCLGVVTVSAQQRGAGDESTAPVVTERGPHHRVIERTIVESLPDGSTRERKSAYTELAQGLHYLNERGEWVESREEIEIFNGAAVARQGPHKVIFAANINSTGAIDLEDAAGQRHLSHVLGLVYTDYASGRSVMIAEIKDSIGDLTAPNQVTYSDAFEGDCVADLRFSYTRSAFEQDVVLRTAPPSPAEWGLNPETTRLEVFTEFLAIPEARVTSVTLKREENELVRQTMKEPDLIDQRLDFGALHIGQGQAFPLGTTPDPFDEASVPTGKSLEVIEGRTILIEKVDYPAVREQLGRLPKSASLNKDRKAGPPDPGRTMQARVLPSRPAGEPGKWTRKLQAGITAPLPPRSGFVLDYIAHSTSSLTNYTFKGDTTYFITNSATVNFHGTTVIEGGAVIKTGVGPTVNFNGPLDCRTDAYRPAFVTAKDDNTVGEAIVGSTGAPSGYYGLQPIGLKDTSAVYDLHDLRVRHCTYAFTMYGNVRADFSHVQIGNCSRAVAWMSGGATTWRNFLFHDLASYAFQRNGPGTNRAEHGTLHRVNSLISATNSTTWLFLTNSLVIAVTNASQNFHGANNVVSAGDSGLFQTVGAAAYYLASGSTNRDAGTTNIHATLRAALAKKTTYPPVILTNAITGDTTLSMQASRDSDTPDLGYHFDPLDYAATALAISNATLTVQAGVGLGLYGGGASSALLLLDGGKVNLAGTPDNLVRIVRYNQVQEQSVTNWSAGNVARSLATPGTYSTNALPGEVTLRFADFSMPAGGSDHLYLGAANLTVNVRDSQFHGGQITALRPDVTILNNLFNRVSLRLYSPENGFTALMRNSTHFGGSVTVSNNAGGTWTLRDNLYDGNSLLQNGTVGNNWNAYLTNGTRLTPAGANDVVLTVTNVTYEKGWLGRFYVPTNLTSHSPIFGSGSQNATASGLYHHTMVTNQTRELSTTVDLGFHYVAVGTNGVPLDTDGDGLADYFEDTDGDGTADAGETDWQSYNSLYGLGSAPAIQVFTPLK